MTSNLSKAGKRSFWEKHITGWKTTGLSQMEYCRVNRIGIKSFHYWKRRIGSGNSMPALVELPFHNSSPVSILSPCPQLCVVVDRYRIEIGKGFDSEDLERVVRTLGRI
jgi:hypothetical protein